MKHKEPITFAGWIATFGVRKLAKRLGVDPSAVSKWAKGTAQPNLDHAATILELAGGKLSASDLKKGGAR